MISYAIKDWYRNDEDELVSEDTGYIVEWDTDRDKLTCGTYGVIYNAETHWMLTSVNYCANAWVPYYSNFDGVMYETLSDLVSTTLSRISNGCMTWSTYYTPKAEPTEEPSEPTEEPSEPTEEPSEATTTTTRHYYAMFIPYGTDTVPGPYNHPTVYVFSSKRQRDDIVTDRWEHFAPISAKDARKISPDQWLHVAPDGHIVD